jgi:hypothetical protein
MHLAKHADADTAEQSELRQKKTQSRSPCSLIIRVATPLSGAIATQLPGYTANAINTVDRSTRGFDTR